MPQGVLTWHPSLRSFVRLYNALVALPVCHSKPTHQVSRDNMADVRWILIPVVFNENANSSSTFKVASRCCASLLSRSHSVLSLWMLLLPFLAQKVTIVNYEYLFNPHTLHLPLIGFGQVASGGRGGTVYVVNSLDDSGNGTFRDAVSQSNRVRLRQLYFQ
jgi:hypothetical protein